MKKILLLLIIVAGFYSCRSTKEFLYNDEYEIAKLSLKKYNNIPIFRLISKPDNSLITRYKNGILDDSLYFTKVGFLIKEKHIYKWSKDLASGDKLLKSKLEIINNYSKIRKVDPLDSKAFISLSNVIYSNDNRYAAIIMNIFHNTNVGDTTAEGYILIYEKIDDRWQFVIEVTAYIS